MKGIWHRMNKYVFENNFTGTCRIVHITIVGIKDFYKANLVKGASMKPDVMKGKRGHQNRPEGIKYKVNFDGALNVGKQKMELGVVIRDCNDDILASMCAQEVL